MISGIRTHEATGNSDTAVAETLADAGPVSPNGS